MTSLTAFERRLLVLVGVDTDAPRRARLGRLEGARTGAAGRGVDDVGAGVVHALRSRLTLGRVAEAGEVRRLGEVLDLRS